MDCQNKLGQNKMGKRERDGVQTFLPEERVSGLIKVENPVKGN